jgi:hypothetical protein
MEPVSVTGSALRLEPDASERHGTPVSAMPITVYKRRPLAVLAGAALLALAGCSSGGSGGVDIGSGQGPDPVTVDFPIAYIKRALPTGNEDARRLRTFQAGADVYIRDRALPAATERNITVATTNGAWDVRDLDASWNGRKLVFSMRAPLVPGADEIDQPTWDIYEYDLDTTTLRRVIASDLIAAEGHDVAPHYLPDGRIVFSSTRQRQSRGILLDEGKPQFAAQDEDRREWGFVLHVMNADGTGIKQLSFNQSHDLDPAVLPDGRIVFSRWDNAGSSGIHLYTINPDGTRLQLLYGANSHDTGSNGSTIQFLSARPRPDGRIVALLRPFTGTEQGGDIDLIDTAAYVENTQPVAANAGLGGPAQSKLTANDVRTVTGASPGGRFASVYPLWDGTNRLLVSWSQCRLLQEQRIVPCSDPAIAAGAATAPPLYSVWIYDPADRTQRAILAPQENIMITEVVALQPRTPVPPSILDQRPGLDFDASLAAENVGILDIKSVYDLDGVDAAPGGIASIRNPTNASAEQRPARFLRIEKAVSLPDRDVRDFRGTAFGAAGGLGMREILAYAPIEPDGSVRVKVPANVAFAISILDANGRRISARHRNWLQVRPGETRSCNGCHVLGATQPGTGRRLSHGRDDLFQSVNPGAPTTGQPFPGTEPALFANSGETMAQVRARISCQTDCAALTPAVDIAYVDAWTYPATAGRAKDSPFAYRYADLVTPAPTTAACIAAWSAQCRVVIHYERNIQPLWTTPRIILAADGATVLADLTCTRCHSPRDAQSAARVPAGQLDLSAVPSTDEPDHVVSYRELLFADNEQEVNMGALQDRFVPGPVDPATGQPTQVPVSVAPPMNAGSANASVRFFSTFGSGGSHAGYLSTAELRLLSEWLDIGAQYFNDPFAAPVN